MNIGIIGFGRFGKVLANILQKGFAIKAYDPAPVGAFPSVEFTDLESVLNESLGSTLVSTIYLSGTLGTFVPDETITDEFIL